MESTKNKIDLKTSRYSQLTVCRSTGWSTSRKEPLAPVDRPGRPPFSSKEKNQKVGLSARSTDPNRELGPLSRSTDRSTDSMHKRARPLAKAPVDRAIDRFGLKWAPVDRPVDRLGLKQFL